MAETARTIYDTHAAVRRLREAGLPEPHAEAVVREQVHLIEHDLATKADMAAVQGALQVDIEKLRLETGGNVEALKSDIEKLRLETGGNVEALKSDIEKLRLETGGNVEALKSELKADIEKLRLETRGNIEAAKADLVKWMVGTNLGVGALIVALVVAALQLL